MAKFQVFISGQIYTKPQVLIFIMIFYVLFHICRHEHWKKNS